MIEHIIIYGLILAIILFTVIAFFVGLAVGKNHSHLQKEREINRCHETIGLREYGKFTNISRCRCELDKSHTGPHKATVPKPYGNAGLVHWWE